MREPRSGLAVEGLPIIAMSGLAALILAIIDCKSGASVFLLLTAFSFWFFRDPERYGPEEATMALAPADGKVVKVAEANDPMTGEKRTVVCIFMNVFNVHVNRAPVAGEVKRINYIPGAYFNASLDKASEMNERCLMQITDKDGASWTVVQIAGLVARRIVCRAEVGDELSRGERFGLIKFGSRLDCYLPAGYDVSVSEGDKTLSGQTPIAKKLAGKEAK